MVDARLEHTFCQCGGGEAYYHFKDSTLLHLLSSSFLFKFGPRFGENLEMHQVVGLRFTLLSLRQTVFLLGYERLFSVPFTLFVLHN